MALIDDLTNDINIMLEEYEPPSDPPYSLTFAEDLAAILVQYLAADGVSGSFTSDDGKTIEVTNGIITGIS